MIIFLLLVIILFVTVTKTQLFKRKFSNNLFMRQLGMALLTGSTTIMIYFINIDNTALKYTVVGMGLMSFIGTLADIIILKAKNIYRENN